MLKLREGIRWLSQHPAMELFAGVVLILTSLADIFDDASKALLGFDLGVEHGVALLGLLRILKAIPELLAGLVAVESGPGASHEGHKHGHQHHE